MASTSRPTGDRRRSVRIAYVSHRPRRVPSSQILWLGWVVYLYVVRNGPSGATFDPDRRCGALGFSCGIATNILASGVLVAFASTFVLWRLFGPQRRYRARARADSRELVPTAGAIINQVVGRDELCMAVMTDLHDRTTRPHVIVGGVGTGKLPSSSASPNIWPRSGRSPFPSNCGTRRLSWTLKPWPARGSSPRSILA